MAEITLAANSINDAHFPELFAPMSICESVSQLKILFMARLRRFFSSRIVRVLIAALILLVPARVQSQQLKNGGFEASRPAESWRIESSDINQTASLTLDNKDFKEGRQSLLLTAERPATLTLRQEIFLPVGTLWRLTGWIKSATTPGSENSGPAPQIGIEAPAGDQGFSDAPAVSGEWQQMSALFRVPSPGRITVVLKSFDGQSGKAWFDDVRLDRVQEPRETESVFISRMRLSKLPIDLKQGGQFIEFQCNLLPSMVAQQVDSTSFEEEPGWKQSYKRQIDKPYRPWYPDGSVHVAKYSFDTENPFNGKRSQKIELPVSNTWAGISQDGFYVESGHSYHLRLHMRGDSNVRVRASLHGNGGIVAGPVLLGHGGKDWSAADGLLTANRSAQNATLTIELEGPGTLWLDRIYFIDTQAVLGLWRPEVVQALKAMKPGILRLGGSTIETLNWEKTIGNWDERTPFTDEPWGGLQENFVGVEEFVQLAQFIGAEPLICVRWTGKTPQDAANEVEYFNGSAESKWGALRTRNGHPQPYHVKYWQIGNEVSGPEYDSSLKAFAQAMRQVDSSVKILSSFPSKNTLRMAAGQVDYLCPHHYSVGDLNGTEENLKWLRDLIDRDRRGKPVRVAVTEWNTTGGEFGLTRGMLLTLGNALSLSRYQNMLHRYADLVEIANRSNLADSFGTGAIQAAPGRLYLTPAYHSQVLYQRAAGSFPLKVVRNNSLPFYLEEPDLDAMLSADGEMIRIYAVNSTPKRRGVSFELDSGLGRASGMQALVLTDRSQSPDSEAMNSLDNPERVAVRREKTQINGAEFRYEFSPFSLTLLEISLQGTPHTSRQVFHRLTK